MKGVGRELHELSQNGQAYMRFGICEDTDLTGEKWGSDKAAIHPKCRHRVVCFSQHSTHS